MTDTTLDETGDGPTVNHRLDESAGIQERMAAALEPIDGVFTVEHNGVWVSAVDACVGNTARRIAGHLQAEGFIVGLIHDDGVHATGNGGLFVPVKGYRTQTCSHCGESLYMVYNQQGNGTQTHVPTPDGSHPPGLSKHV